MAAVTLRSLLGAVEDENLTILAGEDHLDQAVRWIHMVESIEISSFLEGQEITFTTGAALTSQDELYEMVKMIIDNRAAAIVINLGPYIKKVPEKVVEYCREHRFPLITAPWETHMAHIMQIFCMKITEADKESMELSSAVKNAIFFPNQEELYFPALERYHYSPKWSYCAAMIEIVQGVQVIEGDRRRKIQKYIENQLLFQERDVIVFEIEDKILLIFNQLSEEEVIAELQQVIRNYQGLLRKDERSYIGIGKGTKNMQCISKSYNQAKGALRLQKTRNLPEQATSYTELGLYKILLAMEDKGIGREYYQEMLGKLIKYDETDHTDYCKVLECYLNHSGKVKETSEELFVHRNTVNKKINKIEEILGCDLSELDTRVKFKIAFMIQEIL